MTKFNQKQQAFVEKLIHFRGDDPADGFNIRGDIEGEVLGNIRGNVLGDVLGKVFGAVGEGQNDE